MSERAMLGTVVGNVTASCAHCGWSASHAGGDAIEIATFLRRLLTDHCESVHPQAFAPSEAARSAERSGAGE